MPKWEFFIANNRGEVQDPLTNARERKVKIPINSLSNGSFLVDASHPYLPLMEEEDVIFIKAYRDKVFMGQGPVINTQKARQATAGSQQSSVAVNWSSVGWRLGKRLIEASKCSAGVEYGSAAAFMDIGQMAVSIINGINQAPLIPNIANSGIVKPYNVANPAPEAIVLSTSPLAQCDTGIRIGTVAPCDKSWAGPWYFKNALQAIMELSSMLTGFDWRIVPVEPYTDSIGIVFGLFECAPAIGTTKLDVAFEYGDGKKNVSAFTQLKDATGLLNRAYALPTGFPNNATNEIAMQYDWSSIERHNCIYEDTVANDVTTLELRNKLLQSNILVRKDPKQVVQFSPTNDPTPGVIPNYGTEWKEGDVVVFRAVEYGRETINSLMRIYEANFAIDDIGNETITPILIEEEAET